ncbi:Pi4KIIalpha [Strongyloides ratti]|uniref:Phosphatidylinositol 4-kinase type 2 n=1 Tax=Strongyloides ratti TaxID=34506 RepID=A0A090LNS8_STRRB|nr:Pi4KIIalpha [Strongyloides ratti]CEF71520.1 Pi4KIIalpha [Strongyloides ratti]
MLIDGYLSEAGASYIDQKLGLNVVPPTKVTLFAAPTFNYSKIERAKARTKLRITNRYPQIERVFNRIGLPKKIGSLQVFVKGYEDAYIVLRKWESKEADFPELSKKHFLLQFQKLAMLDYIIRNTDRGNDNWLIKTIPSKCNDNEIKKDDEINIDVHPIKPIVEEENLIDLEDGEKSASNKFEENINKDNIIDISTNNIDDNKNDNCKEEENINVKNIEKIVKNDSKIKGFSISIPKSKDEFKLLEKMENENVPKYFVAAIDNGLAFPFKHPDEFRGYPFGWMYLPFAKEPFLQEIIDEYVKIFEDAFFVRGLCDDLKKIFSRDSGFDKRMFSRQMAVMRGQIFNLKEALKDGKSPYELCNMPPQYMCDIKRSKKKRGKRDGRRNIQNVSHHHNIPTTNDTLTTTDGEYNSRDMLNIDQEPQPGPSTSMNSIETATSLPVTRDTWSLLYTQKVQIRKPFFQFWW